MTKKKKIEEDNYEGSSMIQQFSGKKSSNLGDQKEVPHDPKKKEKNPLICIKYAGQKCLTVIQLVTTNF